jgi:hypothetical protein
MPFLDRAERDRVVAALKRRIGKGGAALIRRARKHPLYRFEGETDASTMRVIACAGFTLPEFWRAARGVLPDWWRP